MKLNQKYNRRDFTKITTLGTLGALPIISSASNVLAGFETPKKLQVFVFSKCLQFLDYNELCEVVKEMGFDGIDLTVRPKGHVLPENVTTDLPKATKLMQKYGLVPGMLSTNVKDANSALDQKVLEVAKDLGYTCYRTGWLKYPKDKSLKEATQVFESQLKALEALNEKLGITGGYQNHAGHYFGAPIWDLKPVFEKFSPQHLGVQYDIMHATVEGAQSWQLGFEHILPQINSIVVKDFKWIQKDDGKWKRKYTPMGEGMVDFDKYFKLLKKHQVDLPVSLHVEYELGGAEKGRIPTIDKQIIFDALKKDLTFLRNTWKNTTP